MRKSIRSLRVAILATLPLFAVLVSALAHARVSAAPAVSLLVENARIIPVDPGLPELIEGHLAVGADGRILAIGAGPAPAEIASAAGRTLDAAGRFVAPGFLSAHSHIYMSPLRGIGHDGTLYQWGAALTPLLNGMTAEDVYWFTLHGSLDFLRNGVTTAYDFTYSGAVGGQAVGVGEKVPPPVLKPGPFEENQLKAKADAGLRFVNSVGLPRVGPRAEMIARLEKLLDHANTTYADNPLFLKMAISGGLQRAPTIETAHLEAHVMKTYGLINQSHFLESPDRVTEQREKFYWYLEAGALGPDFIFGHFIQTTPDIVAKAAAAGAHMCWQPSSNGRLASGFADIPMLRAFGMKVGVGLDDQSCVDISDPFQNLRVGLYAQRQLHKSAAAMSVRDMLFLHTLGSAEILGIEADVGSLAVGKFADFLLVDPRAPDTGPLHDPIASYVLACGLRNLKQVYVGGVLAADGEKMLTQDEAAVRAEIDPRVARLQAAAGRPSYAALPVGCSAACAHEHAATSAPAIAFVHPFSNP
jgi:5-methylthioadenosine/S-adenosylhomocysteine deaminase